MFTVRENDGSIDGSGLNWMVLDKDDFAWGGYDTQEEAQEAADQFQAEDNAREYIGNVLFNQLIAPAGNGSLALLSQEDVRELIRQVVDEGGY